MAPGIITAISVSDRMFCDPWVRYPDRDLKRRRHGSNPRARGPRNGRLSARCATAAAARLALPWRSDRTAEHGIRRSRHHEPGGARGPLHLTLPLPVVARPLGDVVLRLLFPRAGRAGAVRS